MSHSGKVLISNGTDFDWERTYCFSNAMNKWEFPEIIPKNSTVYCEVEFRTSPFKKLKNNRGGVVYEFQNVKGNFFVGASSENGFNLFVEYDKFSNLGSNRIDLGWYPNMPFFIYGKENDYSSTKSLNEISLELPTDAIRKPDLSDTNAQSKCVCFQVLFFLFAFSTLSLVFVLAFYSFKIN